MPSQKYALRTQRFKAVLKHWYVRTLFIVTALILLTGCGCLTKPSPGALNPLVVAACPELTPITDPSFGATVAKLGQVAGQYRECRAAALAAPAR